MTDRRIVPVFVFAVGSLVAGLTACGDDDPASSSGGPEAGTDAPASPDAPGSDGAMSADAGSDAPADAPTDSPGADADAGPVITTTLGVTGFLRVMNDGASGIFFEDDQIVRISNAPECVIWTRSIGKPSSRAGTATLGGTIIGVPGGPAAKVTIPVLQGATGARYQYNGPLFPSDNATLAVEIDRTAFFGFPSVGQYTVPVPPIVQVVVTKPVPPPMDEEPTTLEVPSTLPFQIDWTPPAGYDPNASVLVDFKRLQGSTSRLADVSCGFAVAPGKAIIPASVMGYLKTVIGTTAAQGISGDLEILAGFRRDISALAPNVGSFVYQVTRQDTTNFGLLGQPLPVRLQ